MTEDIVAPNDSELLTEYVRSGSKSVFDQIVNHYIHLVHAAAMRQVRDTHLAQDITQAVFLLLWQRAASIAAHGSLGGWLLVTTHHISRNAMRKERRLKRREQKVAQMTPERNPFSAAQADSISPLLDDAIAQLGSSDRDAIVERYFRSRSLTEVGVSLGVSQQAAAKRITRAIAKLRSILARRGVMVSDATLGALLPTVAVQPGATQSVVSAVLAGPAAGVPASVAALARGAAGPWSGMFALIAAGGAALVALGGIVYLAIILQGRAPTMPAQPMVVTPASLAAPVAAETSGVAGEHRITLMLVDANTKTPIANGRVQLTIDQHNGVSKPVGADGKFALNLKDPYSYARIICSAPGRVAMDVEFQNYLFKGDLPANYTIPMEPATTIGGIVTDETGNPLAGARVHVGSIFRGDSDSPNSWVNDDVTTDANGKWRDGAVPADLSAVFIQFTHRNNWQQGIEAGDAVDQLRRGLYGIVLRSSKENQIRGIVMDPDGKGVRGAKVVIARDRYESPEPKAVTDFDGRFIISCPPGGGPTFVTATARGFGPGQVPIPAINDSMADPKPLEIRLSSPVTLEGMVVDTNGRPVNGATIEVDQWRGNRALSWSTLSDYNGKFVWKDAPADPVELVVMGTQMSTLRSVDVTPGGAPIRLTLLPELKVSGKVLDADTGQPIPLFRISYGFCARGQPDSVGWNSQSSRQLSNGRFEAILPSSPGGGKLRIEAEGYVPATSRLIQDNEGSIQIELDLKKGAGPAGTVLSPEGIPVANVRVTLEPAGINIEYPERNSHMLNPRVDFAQTDAGGHFSLPTQDEKFSLLIVDDDGFALLRDDQLRKDGRLYLQKWARIEGVYRVNAGPAKFAKISASANFDDGYRNVLQIDSATTTTDAGGHFVFDRIAPGAEARVYHIVPLGGGSEQYVPLAECKTVAGQTATITIGGKGRPVIGKVLLPETAVAPIDYSLQLNGSAWPSDDPQTVFMRQFPEPENFPDMTEDQQHRWYQARFKSFVDQQAAMPKTQQVSRYPVHFIVGSDGAMRADNVEPGTYQGQVIFSGKLIPNQNVVGPLGMGMFSFTVPTAPACPTDEPLDIGVIQLTGSATFEVGKPLPKIQLTTLEGQAVDPSSWAGKIAVLHFWALNDRKFFPAIHQLADEFKDDPRIQFVNIAVGVRPAWAKRIDAGDHLPGLVAVYSDSKWLQELPPVLVVDAQGTLTAKVADVKDLSAAVEKSARK